MERRNITPAIEALLGLSGAITDEDLALAIAKLEALKDGSIVRPDNDDDILIPQLLEAFDGETD